MSYIVLAAIFVASNVLTALVFYEFLAINIFNIINIEVPAGTIIYPITFVISDIITEIYNKECARRVVIASFLSTLFIVLLLQIVDQIPSASISSIIDENFHKIFHLNIAAFSASSLAYLSSQFLGIHIYHSLTSTSDRFSWLRNFASTSITQLVETTIFFSILLFLNVISIDSFNAIFILTFCLKVVWAMFDTPFCYIGVYLIRYINKKSNFFLGVNLLKRSNAFPRKLI